MDTVCYNSLFYRYSEKSIKLNNPELYQNIINWLPNISISFKERFYLMENRLYSPPKCYCGNKTKFINMTNGFREFCSKKCMYNSNTIKEKRKNTNLKKWGVDNPSKLELVKEKVKNTNNKKFGVDYPLQSYEIRKKLESTFIEKFGVDNPSKLNDIREKVYKTNLEKFGFKHAMQSDKIKEKVKSTFMEKFGVDNPSKLNSIREKAEKTNLEKFGFKHVMQSDEIKEKVKSIIIEKWGVDNYFKTKEYKERINNLIFDKNSKIVNNDINELVETNSSDYLIKCYKCGSQFNIQRQLFRNRKLNKDEICTVCNPILYSSSIAEIEIYNYITSIYQDDIIRNIKIEGKEIDIYLPNLKFGIEYNGLYWHSELNKDKNYHINKKIHMLKNDIYLIQIWEDDWLYKNDIIKSMIKNKISLSNKIWARNCEIKQISDNNEVRKFLIENHIQGFVGSKIKLGLFYKGELVSLMTFGDLRKALGQKSENGSYELLRFCNRKYTTVVGGASKLFKYFINNFQYKSIISYSLNSYSDGNLYKRLGFKEIGKTIPNYFWSKNGIRYNRFSFRKDKLVKLGYDKNKTESEIMYSIGYYKIYDSGSKKWIYNYEGI